jgi:uncharacterized protein YqeY
MNLQEKINQDYAKALKEHDVLKSATLRMLKSALHNEEIKKQGKLSEEEVLRVLNREIKQRQEAQQLYLKGKRSDLAEKEAKESKIISLYLPRQLEYQEIESLVTNAVAQLKAQSPADFGRVMKTIMPQLQGKAPGETVAKILKEKLAQK